MVLSTCCAPSNQRGLHGGSVDILWRGAQGKGNSLKEGMWKSSGYLRRLSPCLQVTEKVRVAWGWPEVAELSLNFTYYNNGRGCWTKPSESRAQVSPWDLT